MLFNSWEFWVFFAVVLPIYWALPFRWQNRFLLAASYYFYGSWDWRFLPLIAFSTVMDYYLGNVIAGVPMGPKRNRYVQISVIANLGLLGVFKYYNFFSQEFAGFANGFGVDVPLPVLNVILPVGISFYTFQSMSYVIDIARGKTRPAKNFLDFALYVSFFPHLVAGPIMRSGTKEHDPLGRGLLKQLSEPRFARRNDFEEGLYHITLGLFKKIVIGDNMAAVVNVAFSRPVNDLTGPEALAAVYAFAWQIYGDFSGYSSIAQGIAKWMGVDLMFNFRRPYLAANPSEFWHRWHISLSTWLRDYLYIPLGGSRGGGFKTYRNLMLTMILGGIWHGANWTFIVWGAFHGAILCAYRLAEQKTTVPAKKAAAAELAAAVGRVTEGEAPDASRRVPGSRDVPEVGRPLVNWAHVFQVVAMFHLACLGWLFFRAESIGQAGAMAKLIVTDFQVTPLALSTFSLMVFYAGPILLYEIWSEMGRPLPLLLRLEAPRRVFSYGYCLSMLLIFTPPVAHEFIYFQF